MRTRITTTVLFLVSLVLVVVPGAGAQSDTPELNGLINAFANGKVVGDVVVVGDKPDQPANDPVSPFGGMSNAPMEMNSRITIEDAIDVIVQGGSGYTSFDDFGLELAVVPEVTADGEFITLGIKPAIPQQWVPPFTAFPPDTEVNDHFIKNLLGNDLPVDFYDQFETGQPFPVDGAFFVPPAGGAMPDANQAFVIRGARTESAFPDGSICGGAIVEMFSGDLLPGFAPWEAADFAPNDSFSGLSHAWVTRCVDGMLQPTQLLVNNGTNFQPQATGAMSLVYPDAFFQIIPLNEVVGTTGWRIGAFATDASNPFQPDNSAFSTLPMYPELSTVSPPAYIEHPWQPAPIHPLAFGYTEGDQGTSEFEANVGILIDAKDDTGEINEFSMEILQFDRYQLSQGYITYDPDTNTISDGVVTGSGSGYTESYDFGTGKYTHDAERVEVFDFAVVAGAIDQVYGELGTLYTARVEAVLADTTTTTSQPPTTSTSLGGDLPSPTKELSGDAMSPFVWVILVGLLLLILGLILWFLFGRKTPDPCAELYAAWQKAKGECDTAKADATAKRDAADKATTAREKAEKSLEDHCKEFPPACGNDASISSEGRTLTRDDLYVSRAWNAAAWAKYKNGGTAQDTQSDWNNGPSETFRDNALKDLDTAKAKTPTLEKAIADTQQAETDAKAAADKAEASAKEVCAKADAAKKAYDDCIGAGQAGAGAGAAGNAAAAGASGAAAGGLVGAAAGAAVGGGGPNCNPQQQAYDVAKQACDDATEVERIADEAVADAHEALIDSHKALEDLCNEYPPLCSSGWIQQAGAPETRIIERDLHLRDMWAEQVWVDYQTDQISAQEVEMLWKEGPTPEFATDELRKLDEAAPLKPIREQAVKDAEAALDAANKKATEARQKAKDACAKAEQAKQALDACLGAG